MIIPDESRRQLVWIALADMYLDTELEESDFQRIAAACAASGFMWSEIKQINYNEVAPALWFNTQDVAGEWAGWDEDWLLARIRQCYQSAPRKRFGSARLWQSQVDFFTKRALARVVAYLP